MSKQPITRITAAEYLSMERNATEKHEFAFGEVLAVAPVSARHVVIVGNIAGELGNRLRQRPSRVYSSMLRLCVDANHCYN